MIPRANGIVDASVATQPRIAEFGIGNRGSRSFLLLQRGPSLEEMVEFA